jgi:hypothetical protein
MAHHSQCCVFPIKLFCPWSSDLSIYHHEQIQISPRRILKKDPTGSKQSCNQFGNVCLGVPYATTLWQVGDALEQSGMVKLEWYREKRRLLTWKYSNNLPRAICPEDVMPLMNKIFYKSYDNLANNKKAVAI